MDFGAHFHDFWAPKSTPNPKRRKYEKPMFYLSKMHVFEVSGHQNRHENQGKIGSGNGRRFLMTF